MLDVERIRVGTEHESSHERRVEDPPASMLLDEICGRARNGGRRRGGVSRLGGALERTHQPPTQFATESARTHSEISNSPAFMSAQYCGQATVASSVARKRGLRCQHRQATGSESGRYGGGRFRGLAGVTSRVEGVSFRREDLRPSVSPA
jgi:hypothetical protein